MLFGELGLPKTKKTKTGYTTDADALAWLAAQTEHELPVIMLRHREQARLRSTVEGLIKTVAPGGRIHTTFNQTVAATGRLSSTDPNLQNIPVRTDEGRAIRRGFVVGEGYESLLTADYSQIELRVMAHLSEDAGLIEAFTSGEDLHTTVGSQVFGVPKDAVDAEMRRKIKAMSYGLAYGLSAFGLSQQLGIGPDEARVLMDTYFERFGGVRDYLHRVVEEARVTGYTETLMGRRRYLPDLNSDNRQRREMAERMALNAPIQGSAADIVKVAMLRVDTALTEAKLGSRTLLQVHDEIVLEVAPGERAEVEEVVRREMTGAYPLLAPLASRSARAGTGSRRRTEGRVRHRASAGAALSARPGGTAYAEHARVRRGGQRQRGARAEGGRRDQRGPVGRPVPPAAQHRAGDRAGGERAGGQAALPRGQRRYGRGWRDVRRPAQGGGRPAGEYREPDGRTPVLRPVVQRNAAHLAVEYRKASYAPSPGMREGVPGDVGRGPGSGGGPEPARPGRYRPHQPQQPGRLPLNARRQQRGHRSPYRDPAARQRRRDQRVEGEHAGRAVREPAESVGAGQDGVQEERHVGRERPGDQSGRQQRPASPYRPRPVGTQRGQHRRGMAERERHPDPHSFRAFSGLSANSSRAGRPVRILTRSRT